MKRRNQLVLGAILLNAIVFLASMATSRLLGYAQACKAFIVGTVIAGALITGIALIVRGLRR